MSEAVIESRHNPAIRHARAVREGKDRSSLFIEGVRLCEEATNASLDLQTVFYSASLLRDERGSQLLFRLRDAGGNLTQVSESVLDFLSDTKTSQGIIAIARRPAATEADLKPLAGAPLVVVLCRVNNPSNAGAMLRVAEAAGATAVISTEGSTDLLSPKSLRGSMGSAFRLPLWTGARFEEALHWCQARNIRTVAASAEAPLIHTEIDWKAPCAIIVGPEASGLSTAEIDAADERIRVPMRAEVESLNVSVALGVILYEAARQRGFSFADGR